MMLRFRLLNVSQDWAQVIKRTGLRPPWHFWLRFPRCSIGRRDVVLYVGIWILVITRKTSEINRRKADAKESEGHR